MGTARRAKPAAAAALIAAALALAACGGDDTEQGAGTDAAEDALSEAEVFRLALDDTCVNSAIGVNEVIAGEIPQRFSDSAEYEAGRAEIREQADVAAAIAPPAELEADYERYLQSLKDYATAYEQSAELAASGDRDGYDVAVQRRGELGDEQIAAAAGLDLTACARRLSPAEDAAVREITQRVVTGADPEASCDEDVTEQLKKNNVGRGDRCIESLGQLAARTAPRSTIWSRPE